MKENTAVYDQIGDQYCKLATLPNAVHINAYTYLNLIGNVENKSVLDLACGEGFYTRKFKPRAKSVLGVDVSPAMIELARAREINEPLGIEYKVSDVVNLGKIADFDLVTASYLLNYAQTREQLLEMCQVIYDNLRVGGRFVTVNSHVENLSYCANLNPKYGSTTSILEPRREGMPITLTFTVEDHKLSFDNYYLSHETYDWAFQQVGFKEVKWHQGRVSPEGIQEFGAEFWQDILDYPITCFIECIK